MRRFSARMIALGPVRFVFLIGLVAGTIQGIPQLLLGGATSVSPQLIPFFIIACTAVIWWSAAFLLWWIAVHRRQSALGIIAAQITLGLMIADVVHNALGAIPAGIQTHGAFTAAILRQPWTFLASNVQLSLIRSPVWLIGSLVVIAMGRHLSGEGTEVAIPPASTQPQAVT